MKILKTIAATSVALGFAAFASAQTDIYLAGSTAFRTTVVNSEIAVLRGAANVGTAHIGGTVQSATVSEVGGTDTGGNAIVFHNHWTGSVAGLADISNNNALSQLLDSQVPSPGTDSNLATGSDTGSAVPLVAMSDNVVADAETVLSNANAAGKGLGAGIVAAGPIDGGTVAGANGGPVASVTFEWVLGVLGSGAPQPVNWQAVSGSSLTATGELALNITQNVASTLMSTGSVPLSVITGNPGDAADFVLYMGRNEDSGSRVMYQGAAWGNGTPNSKGNLGGATFQWMADQENGGVLVGYPTASSGAGYPAIAIAAGVGQIKKWPGNWTLNTEPTVTWTTPGHSGYNGGGDVAAILSSPNPVTAPGLTFTNAGDQPTGYGSGSDVYFVSCVGTSDANTVISHGGSPLSYDGVSFTTANVANGNYELWNHEHLYYLPALAGVQKTGADELADQIFNSNQAQIGAGGIPFNLEIAARGEGAASQIK